MFTWVDSKPAKIATDSNQLLGDQWNMSTKKLKFGVDALYTPLSWLGYGVRFDHVRPDMDGAYSRTTFPGVTFADGSVLTNPGGNDMNFSVLTGRLLIRSDFVTHETVNLQYSRYFLGKQAYPGEYKYQWLPVSDANLVEVSATLWW